MAEKIELVITADASQAINNIEKLTETNKKLHDHSDKSMIKQQGLIGNLISDLKRLEEQKIKAFDEKQLAKLNQKIAEAQKDLKEYNKLGLETEKTVQSMSASISKWILSLGGAAMILKKLKDAFLETTGGMNLFNNVGAATKAILNDIVTTGSLSINTLRQAIATQQVLNDLRLEEGIDQIKISKLNISYQENYIKALDQTLTKEEKLKAINDALEAHNEKINIEMEHVAKQAMAIKKQIDATLVPSEKLVLEYSGLLAKYNNLDAERDASTKRLQSRRSGIIQEENEKELKWKKDLHDGLTKMVADYNKEQLQKQEQYQAIAKRLIEEYDKSQIDSLEGKDKLIAQREFGIKQIAELKKQIALLGPLTDDQIKMLQIMADNVWKEYYKALSEEEVRATPDQQKAISEALLGDMDKLPGLIKTDVEAAREKIAEATEGTKEEFDIWKLIGIDTETEEGQKAIEGIREGADIVKGIIDEVYQKRVDDATRERELIDERISTLENSLDLEIQLMEAGYASNVTAKKKELDDLKKQREVALKAEQEAQKKQAAVQKLQQGISLATSVANILANYTSMGPWGLILAAVAIAALWAIWSSAKTKAASSTKLAEGGSGTDQGIITGKSHHEGGERFLDHIEVERGETFGVLSRRASDKYGKVFHEMVSSFNKDEMPEFVAAPITNSVRVENSGPNSRLDKVIKEQRKLNESFLRQSQLYNVAGKRIVKSGNNIRIVG